MENTHGLPSEHLHSSALSHLETLHKAQCLVDGRAASEQCILLSMYASPKHPTTLFPLCSMSGIVVVQGYEKHIEGNGRQENFVLDVQLWSRDSQTHSAAWLASVIKEFHA